MSQAWSNSLTDQLKALWATDLSAAKIGARLNVSRCAVLSKARRLGLAPRQTGKSEYATSKRLSRAKAAVTARATAKSNAPKTRARTVDFSTKPAEPTKSELRAMLNAAVLNTPGARP